MLDYKQDYINTSPVMSIGLDSLDDNFFNMNKPSKVLDQAEVDMFTKQSNEHLNISNSKVESNLAKVIVLEGLDAAGKTTAMQTIASYLESKGKVVKIIKSDTVGPASKQIRDVFISKESKDLKEDPIACLVSAYNISLIENEIYPALDQYDYILVDRLYHSTAAYQWRSMIGDILVNQMYEMLNIDLLIYLDIDFTTSQLRKKMMNNELDHFESAGRYTFNSRVKAYKSSFDTYPPKDIVIIDAKDNKNIVAERIINSLSKL